MLFLLMPGQGCVRLRYQIGVHQRYAFIRYFEVRFANTLKNTVIVLVKNTNTGGNYFLFCRNMLPHLS